LGLLPSFRINFSLAKLGVSCHCGFESGVRRNKGDSGNYTEKIMKLSEKMFVFGISLIMACALFSGCATRVITPGTPAQPPATNAVTGAITPPVAATPAVTNLVPNATATEVIGYGEQVAPYLPVPYSQAAAGLFGLATVILGLITTGQKKQLNTANAVTTAIVQGVEAAGNAEPSIAAAVKAVKQSVATVSKANGVSDAVETAVNKVTGSQ